MPPKVSLHLKGVGPIIVIVVLLPGVTRLVLHEADCHSRTPLKLDPQFPLVAAVQPAVGGPEAG